MDKASGSATSPQLPCSGGRRTPRHSGRDFTLRVSINLFAFPLTSGPPTHVARPLTRPSRREESGADAKSSWKSGEAVALAQNFQMMIEVPGHDVGESPHRDELSIRLAGAQPRGLGKMRKALEIRAPDQLQLLYET